MKRAISGFCLLCVLATPQTFAESYETLDKKVVEAYNSDPKRTHDMYINAMKILDRSRLDSSRDADAWEDKAQKIISVVCFIEVDKALNDDDYTEAYIWAQRGIENGARNGELGGVRMKELYTFFRDTSDELRNMNEIKSMKFGKTKLEALNPNKVSRDNKYFSEDKRDVAGRRVEDVKPYEILEGPSVNSSGTMYVRIRTNFGTILKIMYYKHRGWKVVEPPSAGNDAYYGSWQDCAKANSKVGNLNKDLVPAIRNKTIEKKTYYIPSKPKSEPPKPPATKPRHHEE